MRAKPVNLGLDMDDTITKAPAFFNLLARTVRADGGRVHVISSRSPLPEVLIATKADLENLRVEVDAIHLLPDGPEVRLRCPHKDLDSYQCYLWQKVEYCIAEDITVYFDDDVKVLELFRRFAPHVQVFHVL